MCLVARKCTVGAKNNSYFTNQSLAHLLCGASWAHPKTLFDTSCTGTRTMKQSFNHKTLPIERGTCLCFPHAAKVFFPIGPSKTSGPSKERCLFNLILLVVAYGVIHEKQEVKATRWFIKSRIYIMNLGPKTHHSANFGVTQSQNFGQENACGSWAIRFPWRHRTSVQHQTLAHANPPSVLPGRDILNW